MRQPQQPSPEQAVADILAACKVRATGCSFAPGYVQPLALAYNDALARIEQLEAALAPAASPSRLLPEDGLRNELHRFALWNSTIWDEESEDDVLAALSRVDEFLDAAAPPEAKETPDD